MSLPILFSKQLWTWKLGFGTPANPIAGKKGCWRCKQPPIINNWNNNCWWFKASYDYLFKSNEGVVVSSQNDVESKNNIKKSCGDTRNYQWGKLDVLNLLLIYIILYFQFSEKIELIMITKKITQLLYSFGEYDRNFVIEFVRTYFVKFLYIFYISLINYIFIRLFKYFL